MLISDTGPLYRSKPLAVADGGQYDIDLGFLKPALKKMGAPVVRQLIFHVRASGTGQTGTLLGEDAYKFFGSITLEDEGGPFFDNIPGSIIRVIEQLEVGDKQIDNAALASGTADSTYDIFAKIHFDTGMAHRGSDTALPLIHLTSGGQISVTIDTPSAFALASATLTVYAVIHDERERECKSRMVWRQNAITAAEDSYNVKGSLRALFVASDLPTTTGYTSLATLTSVTSVDLQMAALDVELLRQEYLAKSKTRASDDEFLASTPNAVALVSPSPGQHIGKMQDLDSVMVDIGITPTSGRMVSCTIKDRNANLAAEWMGFATVADYVKALKARGQVASKGGSGGHVSNWDAKLVRRLPVRIKRG